MNRNSIRRAAIVFGMSIVGFAPAALAQQQQQQQVPHPCAADAQRLCQGAPIGGGAQIACLKAHKSELSPQCKIKVLKAAQQREEQKLPASQQQQQEAPSP